MITKILSKGPKQHDGVRQTRFALFGRAIALAAVLVLGACASPRPVLADDDSAAEQEEFREDMTQYAKLTGNYLEQTSNGTNLSTMTLGWFAYDLLGELSSRDSALNQQFNSGGGDLQHYLKTTFREQPADEIDRLDALTRQDHAAQRLAAKYALEVLRHIPDSEKSAEAQAAERHELAITLSTLRDVLQRTATERS